MLKICSHSYPSKEQIKESRIWPHIRRTLKTGPPHIKDILDVKFLSLPLLSKTYLSSTKIASCSINIIITHPD
jgi:hypothetical protein